MHNRHTYSHIDIGDGEIVQCNDCGAYADAEDEIVHHRTCEPGSSKKWEEYYNRMSPEEEDKQDAEYAEYMRRNGR